jgi:hypothetical protein
VIMCPARRLGRNISEGNKGRESVSFVETRYR